MHMYIHTCIHTHTYTHRYYHHLTVVSPRYKRVVLVFAADRKIVSAGAGSARTLMPDRTGLRFNTAVLAVNCGSLFPAVAACMGTYRVMCAASCFIL